MQPVLLHVDALEFLPTLADKSIDIIFTSPPFKDEDVVGDYWVFYDLFFRQAIRIASKVVIVIHSATKLNMLIAKYPPKRMMVWGKGISQYSYRWNPILLYQISDDYKINKYVWGDAFGIPSVNGKTKVHKYQDPLVLYYTILKMFKDCNLILDPFMGSGTTGVACKILGKDFIGIDFDIASYNVAMQKIRDEQRVGTL